MSVTYLDRLDAQMATTIERLDDRLADVDVPPFDATAAALVTSVDRRRPPVGRWVAAAAVVVIVLGAVGLAVVRDDAEPVADTDATGYLVLSDDAAARFEFVTATVASADDAPAEDEALGAWVQAPEGAESPWPEVLVEMVVPPENIDEQGDQIDIDGTPANLETEFGVTYLRWIAEDGLGRVLATVDLSDDEVVEVARGYQRSGATPGSVPGFEVVHRAPTWEFPGSVPAYFGDPGPGVSMVDYQRVDEPPEYLQIVQRPVSAEEWRSQLALVPDREQMRLGGRDVEVYEPGGFLPSPTGLFFAAWRGDDGTGVVLAYAGRGSDQESLDRLDDLIGDLVALDEAGWNAFVAEHGVADGEPTD
jgi:hypothetical protein